MFKLNVKLENGSIVETEVQTIDEYAKIIKALSGTASAHESVDVSQPVAKATSKKSGYTKKKMSIIRRYKQTHWTEQQILSIAKLAILVAENPRNRTVSVTEMMEEWQKKNDPSRTHTLQSCETMFYFLQRYYIDGYDTNIPNATKRILNNNNLLYAQIKRERLNKNSISKTPVYGLDQ